MYGTTRETTDRFHPGQNCFLHPKMSEAMEEIPSWWQKQRRIGSIYPRRVVKADLCTQIKTDVYVTVHSECYRLHVDQGKLQSTPIPELRCSQEEADTRMFLHAKHAAEHGYRDIIIRSSDTDVEVLALYYQQKIDGRLLVVRGLRSKNTLRVIDVKSMASKWGPDVCNSLLGVHALTGCDSISSFYGKGKQAAFALLVDDLEKFKLMSRVGDTIPMSDDAFEVCQQFTIGLYGMKGVTVINQARYQLFCRKCPQSHQLPPTRDALQNHVRRANYQAWIRKQALLQDPEVPVPEGNGWSGTGEQLSIVWMTQQAAPQALMGLLSCSCKTVCATRRCSCKRANLKCTPACRCTDICCNQIVVSDESDDESDWREVLITLNWTLIMLIVVSHT